MRQLLAKAKHPGHLYPMAMCSWEIMPPPEKLEKHLGERRQTKHAGTGAQPGAAAYGVCVCSWVSEVCHTMSATGNQHAGTECSAAYMVCALTDAVSVP